MAVSWLLKRKHLIFVPGLLLLMVIAVACGDDPTPTPTATPIPVATPTPAPTPTPTPAGPSGSFNVAYKELAAFGTHPRLNSGAQGVFIANSLAETLVGVNHLGAFTPRLVKSWSLSSDNLVWTFELQEGVEFHKGYGEMTTDDVIWNWEQFGAEDSAATRQAQAIRLFNNPAGGMTKIDSHTLEVDTGEIQYDMLGNISVPSTGWIMSKAQVDAEGETAADKNGAGTGPWEIVEAKSGESWTFTAVEDHWRKTPEFAELVLWEMTEEATRLANFQTGRLETFTMDFDSKAEAEKVAGVSFMRVPYGGVETIQLFGNWYVGLGDADHSDKRPAYDCTKAFISCSGDFESDEWKNAAKIRTALSISIDRQLIVDTILQGEGRPLVFWAWEMQEHRFPADMQQWPYDPERAKALMAEAGFADGFDIDIYPAIRNIPGEIEACKAMAGMWEDIGINTTIHEMPYAQLGPRYGERSINGATCRGTSGRADPLGLMNGLHRSTSGTDGGWDHEWMDEKLIAATGTVDEDARFEILLEITRFWYDNALGFGLYSVDTLWPLSSKTSSWVENLEYGERKTLSGIEYAPNNG
jgi:ABC-type transport system substrate-binding protein